MTINDKRYMNNLELHLQQVWLLPDLEDKRLVALDLVNNMEFKGKADQFIVKIKECVKPEKIDEICTNLVLAGEGFGFRKRRNR